MGSTMPGIALMFIAIALVAGGIAAALVRTFPPGNADADQTIADVTPL